MCVSTKKKKKGAQLLVTTKSTTLNWLDLSILAPVSSDISYYTHKIQSEITLKENEADDVVSRAAVSEMLCKSRGNIHFQSWKSADEGQHEDRVSHLHNIFCSHLALLWLTTLVHKHRNEREPVLLLDDCRKIQRARTEDRCIVSVLTSLSLYSKHTGKVSVIASLS